jgi:hypothetical protein
VVRQTVVATLAVASYCSYYEYWYFSHFLQSSIDLVRTLFALRTTPIGVSEGSPLRTYSTGVQMLLTTIHTTREIVDFPKAPSTAGASDHPATVSTIPVVAGSDSCFLLTSHPDVCSSLRCLHVCCGLRRVLRVEMSAPEMCGSQSLTSRPT